MQSHMPTTTPKTIKAITPPARSHSVFNTFNHPSTSDETLDICKMCTYGLRWKLLTQHDIDSSPLHQTASGRSVMAYDDPGSNSITDTVYPLLRTGESARANVCARMCIPVPANTRCDSHTKVLPYIMSANQMTDLIVINGTRTKKEQRLIPVSQYK